MPSVTTNPHPWRSESAHTAGSGSRRLRSGAATATLVVLVGLTSIAVGSVATWLVPPYLVLMAWLIFAPGESDERSRPVAFVDQETAEDEFEAAVSQRSNRADAVSAPVSDAAAAEPTGHAPMGLLGSGLAPAESGSVESATATATTDGPGKPRRARGGRGRGKAKAGAPAPAPVQVSWVRVGPGQFVRVESPVTDPEALGSEDVTLAEAESAPRLVDVPTEPAAGHRRRVEPAEARRPEVAGWRLPDLGHGPWPGSSTPTEPAAHAASLVDASPSSEVPVEPEPAVESPVPVAIAPAVEPEPVVESVVEVESALLGAEAVALQSGAARADTVVLPETSSDPEPVEESHPVVAEALMTVPDTVGVGMDELSHQDDLIPEEPIATVTEPVAVAAPEPVCDREVANTALPQADDVAELVEVSGTVYAVEETLDEPVVESEFDEETLLVPVVADEPAVQGLACEELLPETIEPTVTEQAEEPASEPDSEVHAIQPLTGPVVVPGLPRSAVSDWAMPGPILGLGRSLRRWLSRCEAVHSQTLVLGSGSVPSRRPAGFRSQPQRWARRSTGQLPRGAWRFASRAPPDAITRLPLRRPPGMAVEPHWPARTPGAK